MYSGMNNAGLNKFFLDLLTEERCLSVVVFLVNEADIGG